MKRVNGKNVVITGCNRGIGKAILETFAKNGANVWACVRKCDIGFKTYLEQLSLENHVWIKEVILNLESEESIKMAVREILSEKKSVDILINNAGIPHSGMLMLTAIDEMKHIMNINYFAQMFLIQCLCKTMIKQKKGCIINILSYCGIEPGAGYIAYGASKAALLWATKSLAKEMGRYNIRVNGVAPGFINTRMGVEYNSKQLLEDNINRTIMKRLGEPEEIANVVLFLASDESSFMTGQVLAADGGRVY